jgi:hypothetical protein
MSAEESAPCRHRGVPPEDVVERVTEILTGIGADPSFLDTKGLSPDEYRLALPIAIERLRGSAAASNSGRRDFLSLLLDRLVQDRLVSTVIKPAYGADTVYRLAVPNLGDIAIIQKGCPDGAHSSRTWSIPDWAKETYLWWMCPSLSRQPGEHVTLGVNRLRQKFFANQSETLDGIIFHNDLCGTNLRPCPKAQRAITVGDIAVPPPCIWIMPEPGEGPDFNWSGSITKKFPSVLLAAFGIAPSETELFVGHVGFQKSPRTTRTTISSRFGAGRSTSHRN